MHKYVCFEALLFRPGWRHLTPGEGGEMNTLLTNPEERK